MKTNLPTSKWQPLVYFPAPGKAEEGAPVFAYYIGYKRNQDLKV